MNLLVVYAKIPMSFWNLYRQQRPQANYTIAIACAMTSILVINIWSLCLLISLVDHGWLASRRRISAGEFMALIFGVLVVELIFVDFVQKRVARDAEFAVRVKAASPKISIWYAIMSVGVLASSTILVITL